MKKTAKQEIDIALSDFPANLVRLIIELLDDKSYRKKHNSRMSLVKMGKTIIPQMHKLLDSGNGLLRMEAAKVVELIADKRSIPSFISLLDDKEFEIRWIAAEGLIKIGRPSIVPLIKLIRDGGSSYFVNKGVHHVLMSLFSDREKKKLKSLLLSLDDYHELGDTVPVEASKALKTGFKGKTSFN